MRQRSWNRKWMLFWATAKPAPPFSRCWRHWAVAWVLSLFMGRPGVATCCQTSWRTWRTMQNFQWGRELILQAWNIYIAGPKPKPVPPLNHHFCQISDCFVAALFCFDPERSHCFCMRAKLTSAFKLWSWASESRSIFSQFPVPGIQKAQCKDCECNGSGPNGH